MVDLTHWGGVVGHNRDQRVGEETPELHLKNRLVISREEGTEEGEEGGQSKEVEYTMKPLHCEVHRRRPAVKECGRRDRTSPSATCQGGREEALEVAAIWKITLAANLKIVFC